MWEVFVHVKFREHQRMKIYRRPAFNELQFITDKCKKYTKLIDKSQKSGLRHRWLLAYRWRVVHFFLLYILFLKVFLFEVLRNIMKKAPAITTFGIWDNSTRHLYCSTGNRRLSYPNVHSVIILSFVVWETIESHLYLIVSVRVWEWYHQPWLYSIFAVTKQNCIWNSLRNLPNLGVFPNVRIMDWLFPLPATLYQYLWIHNLGCMLPAHSMMVHFSC